MSDKRRRFHSRVPGRGGEVSDRYGTAGRSRSRGDGVGAQLLGRWALQATKTPEGAVDAPLDASERAELERLRKENADLRLERSFPKKAAVFFASDQSYVMWSVTVVNSAGRSNACLATLFGTSYTRTVVDWSGNS